MTDKALEVDAILLVLHQRAQLAQIQELRRQIQAFVELICEAAPLAWVANQDMEGAGNWEKRAYALLSDPRHPIFLNAFGGKLNLGEKAMWAEYDRLLASR